MPYMSSSIDGLCVVGRSPPARLVTVASQQPPQRAQVEVEVAVCEAELSLQLVHPLGQLHEGLAEPLDLLVAERSALHPAQRLPLHQLTEELDEGEDELREPALHALGIRFDTSWEGLADGLELLEEEPEVALRGEHAVGVAVHPTEASATGAKLYGGQG